MPYFRVYRDEPKIGETDAEWCYSLFSDDGHWQSGKTNFINEKSARIAACHATGMISTKIYDLHKEISNYISENAETLAIMAFAKFCNMENYVKILVHIEIIHEKLGFMQTDLSNFRFFIFTKIINHFMNSNEYNGHEKTVIQNSF